MRKKPPSIHERAEALHQRMKSAPDVKNRQRLHALELVASGQARHRQDVAALLGMHRPSVAAWFEASAQGGIDPALRAQRAAPPVHRRSTETALTALQAKRNEPQGFASYAQLRVWLAEEQQVALSYASVHALVRYKRKATPQRPRPSHEKNPHGRAPVAGRVADAAHHGLAGAGAGRTHEGVCPGCKARGLVAHRAPTDYGLRRATHRDRDAPRRHFLSLWSRRTDYR